MAVRVIDARLGRAKEGHFHEKKIALLAKEDEIETDFEKQVFTYVCVCTCNSCTYAIFPLQTKAPVKPKKFTVSLNTCFFDCARCVYSTIYIQCEHSIPTDTCMWTWYTCSP